MSNYRMHIPAPYVHPIYTDGAIDTPVSDHAPLPVIARDTRLVIANNDTSFVPSLGASGSNSHTDLFGNTNNTIANIGIYSAQAQTDIVIPDAWRIRRFVILLARTASGATSVEIAGQVYGRLIRADGTATAWRPIGSASETSNSVGTLRLVVQSSLSGVFGFDQYRFTFRRNPDSDPQPQLSNIRIYAEF